MKHHHHVVDESTKAEESQYHTLENDFEPCDTCVETQYHGVVSTRNNEPVYHTLEAAGATEEGSTDTYYSSQCMNTNTISILSPSTGYVPSATEGSVDRAAADECLCQTCESGTDENPYHILEAKEASEYQVLTDEREAKHVYQSLEQVTK